MGIETGTYVNDFDVTLPGSTDLRSQGDDHLRLIKAFLKNTFTRATRSVSIPGALSKTANYTVVKDDQEHTIYVNTVGGVCTMTLPTLVAGDVGWKVHFIKTNTDAFPIFIAPPSGTINSGGITALTKARRAIPGVRITAIWDGSGFYVTRALALPIGGTIEYRGSVAPAGYELANGQTLASASTDYQEYNFLFGSGVVPDHRGRFVGGYDAGGAAGRITTAGGGVDGATVSATGGNQALTLAANQIPSLTSVNAAQAISVTGTVTGPAGAQKLPMTSTNCTAFGGAGSPISYNDGTNTGAPPVSASGNNSISVTYTNASQQTVKPLPPTIIANKLVIVE